MSRNSSSVRDRVFFLIKDNPGILRTEIREALGLPNNVVTPAIKKLIDQGVVVEGPPRPSLATSKPGKTLFLSEEYARLADAQVRLFLDEPS